MRTLWVVFLMTLVACETTMPSWSAPERVEVEEKAPKREKKREKRVEVEEPEEREVREDAAGLERRTKCELAAAAVQRGTKPTERLAAALAVQDACTPHCQSAGKGDATCVAAQVASVKACDVHEFDCDRACRSEQFAADVRKLACAAAKLTPTATNLRIGDRVSAQWTNGYWYPGRVRSVYSDDTADVVYDDGDGSRGLPFTKVKLIKRPLLEKTSVGGARPSGPKALVEGASCAGPGWQYVCGGRCTDVKADSSNCGACGNACGDGYRCDGSGTCRTPSGGL